MHSTAPQVRPEPSRGLPHRQVGRSRPSQTSYGSSSVSPSLPGTDTTGRIRPPGMASHSRGLATESPPGMEFILLFLLGWQNRRPLAAPGPFPAPSDVPPLLRRAHPLSRDPPSQTRPGPSDGIRTGPVVYVRPLV